MILFLQMFLLEKFSFSVINNLGTPSSELQINFGVMQIDTENSNTEDTSRLFQLTRSQKDPKLAKNLFYAYSVLIGVVIKSLNFSAYLPST